MSKYFTWAYWKSPLFPKKADRLIESKKYDSVSTLEEGLVNIQGVTLSEISDEFYESYKEVLKTYRKNPENSRLKAYVEDVNRVPATPKALAKIYKQFDKVEEDTTEEQNLIDLYIIMLKAGISNERTLPLWKENKGALKKTVSQIDIMMDYSDYSSEILLKGLKKDLKKIKKLEII